MTILQPAHVSKSNLMNSDTRKATERTLGCGASPKLYNSAIKQTSSVVLAVWRGRADSYPERGEHHYSARSSWPLRAYGGAGNHSSVYNDICIQQWIENGSSDSGLCGPPQTGDSAPPACDDHARPPLLGAYANRAHPHSPMRFGGHIFNPHANFRTSPA